MRILVADRPARRYSSSTWTCARSARRTKSFTSACKKKASIWVRGRGASVTCCRTASLRVKGEDANLGKIVKADVDMVVLCTAIEAQPTPTASALCSGLSRSQDGFFAEAHPKLAARSRPTPTACSLRDAPRGRATCRLELAHAGAAASMALALMDKGEVVHFADDGPV